MKHPLLLCAALLALSAAAPAPTPALAPVEVITAAPAADWAPIAPSDLLVMDLAPGAKGAARRVVIQLLPAPFSQGWIGNIRALAAAKWWDGTSVNRVQDGYVVQWGDPDGEDKAKAKPLPAGLKVGPQTEYEITDKAAVERVQEAYRSLRISRSVEGLADILAHPPKTLADMRRTPIGDLDPYGPLSSFWGGWPVATDLDTHTWPIHCYGTVGVGRDYPPDTGSGAELYTVIGQAPRQLDRNIAVVGRVIEGMEHLSSLPRGTGDIGFYKTAEERTTIRQIRIGTDVPDLPRYQYLSTESASFARYADARANRRDAFYIRPAGGVDICNVPVPVRRVP